MFLFQTLPLQAPLQPLMDNLDSATYEVFERDPVKYVRYKEVGGGGLKYNHTYHIIYTFGINKVYDIIYYIPCQYASYTFSSSQFFLIILFPLYCSAYQ
mgnify:CR=1 FL=1